MRLFLAKIEIGDDLLKEVEPFRIALRRALGEREDRIEFAARDDAVRKTLRRRKITSSALTWPSAPTETSIECGSVLSDFPNDTGESLPSGRKFAPSLAESGKYRAKELVRNLAAGRAFLLKS
ncbi:MAG: hypothetical protein R3C55_16455 [Parvularculaceae bacterium]